MYGIFTYIYHKNIPHVGKYTIHGSYEYECVSRCPALVEFIMWKVYYWGRPHLVVPLKYFEIAILSKVTKTLLLADSRLEQSLWEKNCRRQKTQLFFVNRT